ncbi:MAG TPA: nitrilase-related carbon-nitrogen hydrolase [Baekduia sp.]|uniref:nitrilase-related carbon-nitrogen hydrolase n=1 Tax=Baekduia sp. TaxID=2600305 RepID=UPI002C6E51CC|nr:nitrilase-related carbon-nitrogen hydrolase [Baekduia sp.]HMJ33014.1 nitrilase-related carbon-nitrogen hydrolase [Baekduia sp.]
MHVLLGQLCPVPGDVAANVGAIADALAEHPTAELAVFPELFLGGYDLARVAGLAVEVGDPVIGELRAAARDAQTALVVGFAEALPHGGVANAVACIDAGGSLATTYRKTHLFGAGEREAFVAGDALRVTELAGRRAGPLVCFDIEFPEPARALARAGAELLVTVAANMDPYGPDHALAARARALDNRRPHVYVNRCGDEAGMSFAGGSAVIGPDGSVQHQLGRASQLACVELAGGPATGLDADYLQHLRPDLAVEDDQPIPTHGATS